MTPLGCSQRTYSQWIGGAGLRADRSWRTFVSSIPKGLMPSNRPFLGHGGMNDAEWLLHRGRCFTQTNTGPMEKDHPGWKHLNASLRDKVEILSKNPYTFLHLPQRLDVSRACAARDPVAVLASNPQSSSIPNRNPDVWPRQTTRMKLIILMVIK